MPASPIEIVTFCSLKGGVGKSTLAVACATARAAAGQPVLLVDGDLTGTSLADALPLRAPAGEGAPPLSRERTLALRQPRQQALERREEPEPPYFLQDVLVQARQSARVDPSAGPGAVVPPLGDSLWRMDGAANLWVVPSSSVAYDLGAGIVWQADNGAELGRRLAWWLVQVTDVRPDLRTVVVDLSPGVFGFAREALVALGHLCGHSMRLGDDYPGPWPEQFAMRPYLVTSEEPHDVFTSAEAFFMLRASLLPLRMLMNRSRRERAQVLARVDALLRHSSPALVGAVAPHLRTVDELDALRDLFWAPTAEPKPKIVQALQSAALVGDGP